MSVVQHSVGLPDLDDVVHIKFTFLDVILDGLADIGLYPVLGISDQEVGVLPQPPLPDDPLDLEPEVGGAVVPEVGEGVDPPAALLPLLQHGGDGPVAHVDHRPPHGAHVLLEEQVLHYD